MDSPLSSVLVVVRASGTREGGRVRLGSAGFRDRPAASVQGPDQATPVSGFEIDSGVAVDRLREQLQLRAFRFSVEPLGFAVPCLRRRH